MEHILEIVLSLLLAAAAWFGWKQSKAKEAALGELSNKHEELVAEKVKHEEELLKQKDDIYEELKRKHGVAMFKRSASKPASKRRVVKRTRKGE